MSKKDLMDLFASALTQVDDKQSKDRIEEYLSVVDAIEYLRAVLDNLENTKRRGKPVALKQIGYYKLAIMALERYKRTLE